MSLFRNALLAGAAVLVATPFAACGGDDSDDSDATATAAAPAQTTIPGETATRPSPTDPPGGASPTEPSGGGGAPPCTSDDIGLRVLPAGGAVGTHFVAISVANTSDSDCSVAGFPGVSLTDAAGNTLGEPAARNAAVGAETIVIAPGEAAHAMVGLPNHQNFPPGECAGPSTNLVVYPPGETEAISVPFEDYACPGFSVRVFEPGAEAPGR